MKLALAVILAAWSSSVQAQPWQPSPYDRYEAQRQRHEETQRQIEQERRLAREEMRRQIKQDRRARRGYAAPILGEK